MSEASSKVTQIKLLTGIWNIQACAINSIIYKFFMADCKISLLTAAYINLQSLI